MTPYGSNKRQWRHMNLNCALNIDVIPHFKGNRTARTSTSKCGQFCTWLHAFKILVCPKNAYGSLRIRLCSCVCVHHLILLEITAYIYNYSYSCPERTIRCCWWLSLSISRKYLLRYQFLTILKFLSWDEKDLLWRRQRCIRYQTQIDCANFLYFTCQLTRVASFWWR